MALLLLSLGAATFSYAQTTDLPFKSLNHQNGLLGDINAFMFRDSRGFMWISSLQGLNRFDSRHVKTYNYDTTKPRSLWGNNIQSPFFEDKKGDIWFCTDEAINVYRRQRDDFDHFYVHDAKGKVIKNDYYIFDLDASGFIWLRVGNYKNAKLYRFNSVASGEKNVQDVVEETHSEEMLSNFSGLRTVVQKSPSGTNLMSFFWGGKFGIEEYKYDNNLKFLGVQSYFSGGVKDAFSPKDTFKVRQIIFDSLAKGFWVATQRGLVFWNKRTAEKSNFNTFKEETVGILTDIVVQKEVVLATSRAHGILVFDKKKQQFIRQIVPKRLDTEGGQLMNFDNLFLDNEDNLWASSFNNGLFYTNIRRPKFGLLKFPSSTPNVATDNIIEDNEDNKWIVKRGEGIVVVNRNQEVLPHFFTKNLTDFIIRLYHDHEGMIWALTAGQNPALYRFNPSSRAFDRINFADNLKFDKIQFYDIFQISDGRLLIGSSKGIFQLDKSAQPIMLKKCPIMGIEGDWDAVDVFEDSYKTIYLNQNSQNLLMCRLEKSVIQKIKELPINGEMGNFTEFNKQLWVASNKGLLVFDHAFEQLTPAKTYLLGNTITGLLMDSSKHFWLTTSKGLLNFDPLTGNYHRFSLADMMQGYSFGQSALADKNGLFWFGGINGVNIFKPSNVQKFPFAPRPHIVDITVNNAFYRPDSSITEKKCLVLPYDSNSIRLQFVAVEFSDATSDSVSFCFYLANTPLEKRVCTTVSNAEDPSVNFVNLSEGHYILELKAVNSDDIWSETRILELEVLPPWYRTWQFYVALFTLLSALVYGVVRRIIFLRERRLKQQASFEKKIKETELKVLRSQMNPHFIFNSLNSIREYVLKNKPLDASMFLADFADLMRKILNYSTKETISLEKEEEILRGYLGMEKLRFDFDFDILIDEDLDAWETEVPTMILQPFAENAVLHGVAHKKDGVGFIQIRFDKAGDFILCSVEDNGIGLAKAAEKKPKNHVSKSQQITQDRLDILTQLTGKPTQLFFENVETGGTKVTIKLPINI